MAFSIGAVTQRFEETVSNVSGCQAHGKHKSLEPSWRYGHICKEAEYNQMGDLPISGPQLALQLCLCKRY